MEINKGSIDKNDWDDLLLLIRMQQCTPFIGAGACYPYLPMGAELAHDWSNRYNYPLTRDFNDLAKVAQFMAIDRFPMFPKHILAQDFGKKQSPDFSAKDEPHGILADLNLPLYVTTNYDNFMVDALKTRHRNPKQELCRWSNEVDQILKLKQITPIINPGYVTFCGTSLSLSLAWTVTNSGINSYDRK